MFALASLIITAFNLNLVQTGFDKDVRQRTVLTYTRVIVYKYCHNVNRVEFFTSISFNVLRGYKVL